MFPLLLSTEQEYSESGKQKASGEENRRIRSEGELAILMEGSYCGAPAIFQTVAVWLQMSTGRTKCSELSQG